MTLILSRRHALALGMAATLAAPGLSLAQAAGGAATPAAPAANASTRPVLEMTMGDPKAPIIPKLKIPRYG